MTNRTLLRWSDYVFASATSDSCALIEEAAAEGERRVLLICGGGFDPRTLEAPRSIADMELSNLTVVALQPTAEGQHDDAIVSATSNIAQLQAWFGDRFSLIEAPSVAEVNSAGTILSRDLVRRFGVFDYDTVIVDMSGLPSTISFSVIHLFLQRSASAGDVRFDGNLLVIVAEDAQTDERIIRSELGRASVLNALTRLPPSRAPIIWMPVLGERSGDQLEKIRAMLEPEEVCPVVPFPSSLARRGDNLVVEHGDLLFDVLQFEPRNILHASEFNPFDLYRQMVMLARRYRSALAPLGEPTIATSEHGSKLMSLGVLLASHEERIVVAQVDTLGYRFESAEVASSRTPVLYAAWLTGSPYDVGGRRDDESDE